MNALFCVWHTLCQHNNLFPSSELTPLKYLAVLLCSTQVRQAALFALDSNSNSD